MTRHDFYFPTNECTTNVIIITIISSGVTIRRRLLEAR